MRHGLSCIAILLTLTVAGCGGTEGTAAAEACSEVSCPTGTAPLLDAQAESACSASVSGTQGLDSVGASASAACVGSGSCSLICEPVSQCCGGESWTDGSYTCETPCAAACSCSGKCGTVTGPECSAECGNCTGNQSCLDNECVDACPDDVTTCGAGVCCDSGTAVCVAGECCDPVTNCTGRACGDDGCGGQCEALGEGWGCDQNEVCENYACVLDNDCGGSLPVCEIGVDGEPTGLIRNCGSDGKWADGSDCNFNELGKNICVMTSAGAVCAECGDDDDCSEGGICVVKPGGAECAECTEDIDCQSSEVGQACKNGKCGCSNGDDCAVGQDCVAGTCEGTACDPSLICDPPGGPKRYCGADGCGGFCGDMDFSCNGTGVCGEDGFCQDKAMCKVVIGGDGSGLLDIPWGLPFCNGDLPNWDTQTPPFNPTYNSEAVVSCHWVGPTEENPTQNECVCEPHEFDDAPEGEGPTKNCAIDNQLCKGLLDEFQALNAASWNDFACLEPTTCLEATGLPEQQRFCNTINPDTGELYSAEHEEGWVIECEDQDGLIKFHCTDCEKENGKEESSCDDPGMQCYPKDYNGDGTVDSAACEESKADWCPEGDVNLDVWEPGCCAEGDDSCDGVTLWQGGEGSTEPGNPDDCGNDDNPCPPYVAPTLRKVCAYDPVHNTLYTITEDCAEAGQICVEGGMEEGDWSAVGTCATPVEPCPNGEQWDSWCNAPGDDFVDSQPEGARIFCEVYPEANTKKITGEVCGPPNNDEGTPEEGCAEDPNDPWSNPNCCEASGAYRCVEHDGGASCDPDQSHCCDDWTPTCPDDSGPSACEYNEATNEWSEVSSAHCDEGTECVQMKWIDTGEHEQGQIRQPAVCETTAMCPNGDNWYEWCNAPESDHFSADHPEGAKVRCDTVGNNQLHISSQSCQDWANETGTDMAMPACEQGDSDEPGCCIPSEWACFMEGDGATCDGSYAHCCDEDVFTPFCLDNGDVAGCEYHPEDNTVGYPSVQTCGEAEACVHRKYADPATEGEPYYVPGSCEAVASCAVNGNSTTACNTAGADYYNPEWPLGVIECWHVESTNQLAWQPVQDSVCNEDQECYPGGPVVCKDCKPSVDAEWNSWDMDQEHYQDAACAVRQACPTDPWCKGNATLVSCHYDENTNYLHREELECKASERCVITDNEGPYESGAKYQWVDPFNAPGADISWYQDYVAADSDMSIWNAVDKWSGACVDASCGPVSTDGTGEPTYSLCEDPTTMTCYEPADQSAWQEIYAEASGADTNWTPTHGCLPTNPGWHHDLVYVETAQTALGGSPDSWPEPPSDNASAVAFCNSGSNLGYVGEETSMSGPAPIFVVWGWLDTSEDGVTELSTSFDPMHIFAETTNGALAGEGSKSCTLCDQGPVEEQTHNITCCLMAYGISMGSVTADDCL